MLSVRKILCFRPHRRAHYATSIEAAFQVWNSLFQTLRTRKVRGRLTRVSRNEACLHTNHMLVDGYHRFLDAAPTGESPILLTFPGSPGKNSWTVRGQVAWYDKAPGDRIYHFAVGFRLAELSQSE